MLYLGEARTERLFPTRPASQPSLMLSRYHKFDSKTTPRNKHSIPFPGLWQTTSLDSSTDPPQRLDHATPGVKATVTAPAVCNYHGVSGTVSLELVCLLSVWRLIQDGQFSQK